MIHWKKLKRKIPNKIKVHKSTYEVLWTDEFLTDQKQMGETRFDLKQIVLKKDDDNKEALHTFFHEWLHVLVDEHQLKLTHKQVYQLEKCLPDFINLLTTLGYKPDDQ